ncbi:cysteine hydrolase family protein [Brevibacillus choshinensis]|uniref:Cysteine hydrolase n=1 Tax=Brevibacillus choshinensis TaxID=54911 RepID=A0ABX7FWG4_BRECH|nr:cysteine hydrolase family protein [Brevibacillus choshinensis]QRG70223.1 cysteine hydrolase [Brevibacillus choshinensis]
MSQRPALLVVDAQTFLIEHAFQGQELAERIQKVIERARDLQIPVIYIQHCEKEGEFAIGTPTWQIHPAFSPAEEETVIQKFACDSFLDTPLREVLESKEINHLVICGLQTEYCIDTTSRRAISFGYGVTLVGDGHSTFDNSVLKAEQIIAHHNAVLNGFGTEQKQISVKNAESLFV